MPTDWALHVTLLLDTVSLETLPQRWVVQLLLFSSATAADDIDRSTEPRLG